MKRRISAEQLNELTPEQKERLREWWKPEICDHFTTDSGEASAVCNTYHKQKAERQNTLPLLDIGQMIELLLSKRDIECMYDASNCYIAGTDIELSWNDCFDGAELCDALWNAVKACL